jgi:serine/threonine-protein kinase
MARVFTITEGLENMGAMKTGGQGSVYKGRPIIVPERKPAETGQAEQENSQPSTPEQNDKPVANNAKGVGLYTVDSKAFFHNEPDESTRRAAFINKWNNAVLAALDERNGFIYVVFTNKEGQTSKGWLRKQDVTRINR